MHGHLTSLSPHTCLTQPPPGSSLQTDPETDRPYEPPFIKSVEVLSNPFEDIVPRTLPKAVLEKQAEEERWALGGPSSISMYCMGVWLAPCLGQDKLLG